MLSILKYKENEAGFTLDKIDEMQKIILEKDNIIKEKNEIINKLNNDIQEKDKQILKLSARFSTISKIKDINSWIDKD